MNQDALPPRSPYGVQLAGIGMVMLPRDSGSFNDHHSNCLES